MRRTTMFALLGLAALPAVAVAQTTNAPTSNPPMSMSQGGMGMSMGMGKGMCGPENGHHHGKWRWAMRQFHKKFDAANTTHDGHLTLDQAKKANLKMIVANFSAIDMQHRGYVTFNDVIAWRLDKIAERMENRAAELRGKD